MKQFLSLLVMLVFLAGCTSDEGSIKKLALCRAEQEFKADLQKEAADSLPDSQVLQQAYIDFMHSQSEMNVETVKLQGERNATAAITITAYSATLRRNLLGVARGVGSDKTRRFNFANAVPLVASQIGVKPEKQTQPYQVYRYQKQGEAWVEMP